VSRASRRRAGGDAWDRGEGRWVISGREVEGEPERAEDGGARATRSRTSEED
jgi:hypothetical protein